MDQQNQRPLLVDLAAAVATMVAGEVAVNTTYICDGKKIIGQTNNFQEACWYYIKNRPQNENLRLMDEIPIEVIVAAYIVSWRQSAPAAGCGGTRGE